jgi:hypothetical protein
MSPLISLFVPLAVEIIKAYFKTTDTKKDDQVLEVVQQGCYYLAPNKNNDMNVQTADIVANHTMTEGV